MAAYARLSRVFLLHGFPCVCSLISHPIPFGQLAVGNEFKDICVWPDSPCSPVLQCAEISPTWSSKWFGCACAYNHTKSVLLLTVWHLISVRCQSYCVLLPKFKHCCCTHVRGASNRRVQAQGLGGSVIILHIIKYRDQVLSSIPVHDIIIGHCIGGVVGVCLVPLGVVENCKNTLIMCNHTW